MFNILWKLRVNYLKMKWKIYILKGDLDKANKVYKEILKMAAAYADAFLEPVFNKQHGES